MLCAKPSISAMASANWTTSGPHIVWFELLVFASLRGDAVSETLIGVLDRKLLKDDENGIGIDYRM